MFGTRRINWAAEVGFFLGVVTVGSWSSGTALNFPEFFVLAFVASLLAVVLGWLGRRAARRSGGALGGGALGGWAIAFGAVGGVCACVSPAVVEPRGAAHRAAATNNLKQIGLALHNYHAENGRFPPAVVRSPDGRPLYSWRVLLLPYMEERELYKSFHLDEPWDSPHNYRLLGAIPVPYRPVGEVDAPAGSTFCQAFVGPGTAFAGREGEPMTLPDGTSNFPDGLSETIVVAEVQAPVPWSAPFDASYIPGGPLPRLGGSIERRRRAFRPPEPPRGFLALLADGSVRWIKADVPADTIRAMLTRNGAEPSYPDAY